MGSDAHINTRRHAFPNPGTHLLLHPVVFVDGVLVFGRRDPEEGGHPLPEVIAGWGRRRRTDGQSPCSHHRKRNQNPSLSRTTTFTLSLEHRSKKWLTLTAQNNLRWWTWQLSTSGTRSTDPRSAWTATTKPSFTTATLA